MKWVHLGRPTEKELDWLKKTYHFHPIIIDELRGPSARARIETNSNYLYLIYYFPLYDPNERVSTRSEIDFLITKKEVITVCYDKNEVLEGLLTTLNPKTRVFSDTLQLTHKLLESLLSFQQRQLVHIREKIDRISTELFRERERERERTLLESISYLKRDISQYRIIIKPQKHILTSFFENGCSFLGPTCQIYMNDLLGEHMKVIDQLEDYRQAIEDFEATNNQLINLKNIQVTKTFTILAFLTFPLMLFAALFSMDVGGVPLAAHPFGFWIILAVMIVAMAGMFAYFRKKDWI